ncbi:MAG: tripartite tricarboxylate transporter substrate binding protein, partial [Alphaproteobacteria bacterium]
MRGTVKGRVGKGALLHSRAWAKSCARRAHAAAASQSILPTLRRRRSSGAEAARAARSVAPSPRERGERGEGGGEGQFAPLTPNVVADQILRPLPASRRFAGRGHVRRQLRQQQGRRRGSAMNATMTRRSLLSITMTAGLGVAFTRYSRAQPTYPDKPIKIILPYTAGSPNDVFARAVAPLLSSRLKQPVIVDNRPGGGTLVGVKAVMASPPDGYTLLFTNTPTHVIAQFRAQGTAYDPIADFVPIVAVGVTSLVLVVSARTPANTLQEFIAYAKSNPGKLNFGFGQGTLPHLIGEAFKLPLIRAGKIKALAVTSPTRGGELPDIPTMIECGLPGLTTVTHYGFLGPTGIPADVVAKLNVEMNEGLKSAEVRANMINVGIEPTGGSPQD